MPFRLHSSWDCPGKQTESTFIIGKFKNVTKYLDSLPRRPSPYVVNYNSMGFAVKNYTEASKVNSQDFINFMVDLFMQGEQKNRRKVLPGEAVELMRNAKKSCGERRFLHKDWLKENQIKNLFGCFADCL